MAFDKEELKQLGGAYLINNITRLLRKLGGYLTSSLTSNAR
mgnify:FL=1